MENIIQKHRAFVAGQIQKSFESNLQSSGEEVEKAWNVGDEKQYLGVTYYVGGFNAKGQPLWRKKKDGGGGGDKKAGKSKAAANKIDDTTIDQAEYDSQFKIAKQVDDSSRSIAKNIIQGNIDKTKKKLQETISNRPGAKATITALQKDLTKFISQKKAVEDAEKKSNNITMSGDKSNKKKADLPFTDLTKHSQVIDYAKTINGADFEEIDSEFGDRGSKAFRLNYNGGLKLDVDFPNNGEYIYTFRDKNDNSLYEMRSTRETDETDWSIMLNPRKWANSVKSNISKHISQRKAEQTRYFNSYSRRGKNSDYDKYLNAKFAIDRLNRNLNKVDKILQLS